MARIAIGFGVALVALGVVGYFATGRQSPTALIPAGFGAVLAVLGWIALNPSRRKHAMHAAAVIALIGFLGTVPGVIKAFKWMGGTSPERPAAVVSQTIMAAMMLAFILLCVRSFVEARRQRS